MKRRAYFWAEDFTCSPSVISAILCLAPSEVWVAGETLLPKNRVAPRNAWRLESEIGAENQLDAHIEDLLDRLTDHLPQLRAQIQPLSVGLNCVGHVAEFQGYGFHLSADLIHRLADQGLSVDFDIYGAVNE
jgi:hypothetical protein